jgi:hypothetical protein
MWALETINAVCESKSREDFRVIDTVMQVGPVDCSDLYIAKDEKAAGPELGRISSIVNKIWVAQIAIYESGI